MVAGWLMIAALLQAFINFDELRQYFFPGDVLAPRGIKIICMYSYFLCDWYWIILMLYRQDVIGWQQIVGSLFDIILRLPFALKPDLMFKSSSTVAPVSQRVTAFPSNQALLYQPQQQYTQVHYG